MFNSINFKNISFVISISFVTTQCYGLEARSCDGLKLTKLEQLANILGLENQKNVVLQKCNSAAEAQKNLRNLSRSYFDQKLGDAAFRNKWLGKLVESSNQITDQETVEFQSIHLPDQRAEWELEKLKGYGNVRIE